MSSRTVESIHRRTRQYIAAAGLLFGLTITSRTMAQENPKVAAEALFSAGQTLLQQGQYADACKSFTQSQRLDASVGTLLNLGLCNEKQGKLASAWAAYKEAAQLAHVKQDQERESAARDLAAKLEPRLSHLTILAKNAVPGLIVRRDGLEVGGLGVPLAVDPGPHAIEALAPGRTTWSGSITIGPEGDQKSIDVPPLERAPEDATLVAPIAPRPPAPAAPTSSKGNGAPLLIAGFSVGGAGVVGLAVGTAFGVVASNTASSAEDDPALCPSKVCSSSGRARIDEAETQATGATVGFAIGGVALATGVLLVAIGFSAEKGGDGRPRAALYRSRDLSLEPYFGGGSSPLGSARTTPMTTVVGVAGTFQ